MTDLNVTTEEIAAMLETGRKPDTAGQRTWPNWKVAVALATTTAETERLRAVVKRLRQRELATIKAAANIGYITCAKMRHVTLGDKVRSEIETLAQQGGDARDERPIRFPVPWWRVFWNWLLGRKWHD